jgi:hypothetical protein
MADFRNSAGDEAHMPNVGRGNRQGSSSPLTAAALDARVAAGFFGNTSAAMGVTKGTERRL